MFLIQQQYAVTPVIPFIPDKNHSEGIPQDKLRIIFSDEVDRYYDSVQLTALTYFRGLGSTAYKEKQTRSINLKEWDINVFNLVAGLIIERKTIEDLLTDESYKIPNLMELLTQALNFFAAQEAQNVLQGIIQNNTFAFMTLEVAEKVVSAYPFPNKESIPFAVLASENILNRMIFFKDRTEAAHYFRSLHDYHKEMLAQKRAIAIIREKHSSNTMSPTETVTTGRTLESCEKLLREFTVIQESLIHSLDSSNLSAKHHYYASLHVGNANPKIAFIAKQSKVAYENLREEHVAIPRNNKGRSDRPELEDCLAGPAHFLCPYYDIHPFLLPGADERVFLHQKLMGVPFHFDFSDHGPWWLEEKIRTTLQKYVNENRIPPLPPRLIQEPIVTTPITPETETMTVHLLPKLKMWDSHSIEQQNQMLDKLIKWNGWDSYGIQSSDIALQQPPFGTKDLLINGELRKFNVMLRITLSLVDFKMCIAESDMNYNVVQTHNYLKTVSA